MATTPTRHKVPSFYPITAYEAKSINGRVQLVRRIPATRVFAGVSFAKTKNLAFQIVTTQLKPPLICPENTACDVAFG